MRHEARSTRRIGADSAQIASNALKLSIILPAYNEEDLLEDSVTTIVAALRERREPFEVVVVENGSTDGTVQTAERLIRSMPEVRLMSLGFADYGQALRAGLLAAGGKHVVNFDVDLCDLDFLYEAVALLEGPSAPAVVVGTKRGQGAVDTRAWPRRLVTLVFSELLRFVFGLRVSDTHGIKAMNREDVLPFARACVFGTDLFDTELILRVERAGLPTTEIPVTIKELRPARSSMVRRIPRTVRNLVRLRVVLWREGARGDRRGTPAAVVADPSTVADTAA